MSETEKLISLVKNYPTLYDAKNKDYKDITKKANAWYNIAVMMNLQTGAEAKNKWRHLRDSYAKHLRTHSNSAGQCSKKYKHWPWAYHMEFLRPHVTTRRIKFSSIENSDSDTDVKIKTEPTVEDRHYDNLQVERIPSTAKNQNIQQYINLDLSDDATEYLQTGNLQKDMDAIDLLFLSYAQTVRTFSPRRQATVKLEIAQVISNAEIAQLEGRDPLMRPPTSPPLS